MTINIARRKFIAALGGAAVAWPLAARAQQPKRMRRIGWLVGLGENDPEAQRRTAAFVQELEHLGWTQGRNVEIDYRWLSDSIERNKIYAQELAAIKPDVLVSSSTPAIIALRQETANATPIVFAIVTDPVSNGLVASLAAPGGNVTGFTNFEFTMGGKWLEVLKQAAPHVVKVALIYNAKTTPYAGYLRSIEASAPSVGVELSTRGVPMPPRSRTSSKRPGPPPEAVSSFFRTFSLRPTTNSLSQRRRRATCRPSIRTVISPPMAA